MILFSFENFQSNQDTMGKEHNVRWTAWIPTFLVVVSTLVIFLKNVFLIFWKNFHSNHSVFWDLYCAAPERRDTCEHSSEAKAFHDYVSVLFVFVFLYLNLSTIFTFSITLLTYLVVCIRNQKWIEYTTIWPIHFLNPFLLFYFQSLNG